MLDPTDSTSPIAWQDLSAGLRVVTTPRGPIVELADGKDSTGALRWIKAVVTPDRTGHDMPIYEGWKEIANAAGFSDVSTAYRHAHRKVDPLPVIRGQLGRVWIFRSVLRAWVTAQSYPLVTPEGAKSDRRRSANRMKAKRAKATKKRTL